MKHRALGSTGLDIAPLVLGGNVFGWTADEPTSHRILDAFVEAGFNAIDTADVYTAWVDGHRGGESERVIGSWLRARPALRDKIVLFTKVGSGLDGAGRPGGLTRRWITDAVDASLARMNTDVIDVYFSHWPDPQTPVEETLSAYADLQKAGKIRAIGASNMDETLLQPALEVSREKGLPRYDVVQPEYNLYARKGYEAGLQELCVSETIACVPYYGLASGFLTGKYRSEEDFGKSVRGARMGRYMTERGLALLDRLDAVADRHKVAPAEIALAWLMAQPGVTAPIASASRPEQVNSFARAASVRLSEEDLAQLDIPDV